MIFRQLFFLVVVLFHQALCNSSADNVGIFGGNEIPIETAPYMVSLRVDGSHQCGGSIIHEQFVLTAAHCGIQAKQDTTIVVGTEEVDGSGGQVLEVKEIIVHTGFSFENGHDDIGLIKLKEPLIFGPKVSKIKLATPNTTFNFSTGTELKISGWGLTEQSTASPKLLQALSPFVDEKSCQETYNRINLTITPNMICAGDNGHGACNGDSGGPLTFGDIQVGIASLAIECGLEAVIYTKVSAYFCWIMEKMYLHK